MNSKIRIANTRRSKKTKGLVHPTYIQEGIKQYLADKVVNVDKADFDKLLGL